jgi:sialic acid synthase SpsE
MALMDIQKVYPNFILGLSDHTRGTLVSSTSVALGARVIEKHFTVDKNLLMSPDHAFANDENELRQLVDDSNNVLKSLGSGRKEVLECELPARNFARRSIVSEIAIKKGETITQNHLSIKRPGTGIQPSEMTYVIGMKAKVDIPQDQLINLQDLMN